jgi:hypothetical protein
MLYMIRISKSIMLSAIVVSLLIAGTAVAAVGNADATLNSGNNIAINSSVNQQNSSRTSSIGSTGDTSGGNACESCSASNSN